MGMRSPSDQEPDFSLRPPRKAFVLAYVSIVASGILGAAIGAGLVDVMCSGACTLNVTLGALTGAALGAGGVGVVAMLVLRAMHEWNVYQADQHAGTEPASEDTPPRC